MIRDPQGYARSIIGRGSSAEGSARTEGGRARALVAMELRYMAANRRELARLIDQSANYRAGRLAPHLQEMSDPITLRGGPSGRFRQTAKRLPAFRSIAARIP